MRTTLDIDDDVLSAARELARARRITAGEVISDLARRALTGPAANAGLAHRSGFRLLPPSKTVVTPELVEKLLEEGS